MITEYVLLLVASVAMITVVLTGGPIHPNGGIKGIFTQGIPQLAIRMEKHLITGYPFCVQYPKNNGGTGDGCNWTLP